MQTNANELYDYIETHGVGYQPKKPNEPETLASISAVDALLCMAEAGDAIKQQWAKEGSRTDGSHSVFALIPDWEGWRDDTKEKVAKLTAENERLKGCLKKTNNNMEQGERELYLQINGLEDSIDKLTAERDTALSLLRRSTPFLGGWVGYQEVRDDIEAFLQQFDGNGNGQGTLTAGGE